jgi:diacylglycerol O-acyltransferase 2, plant
MHALLKAGHSIAVHVGGIAEMFEVYPDREVIHLSKRRGFVRAAVQHGVPIIPMYHFGNTQILSFFPRYEAFIPLCAAT